MIKRDKYFRGYTYIPEFDDDYPSAFLCPPRLLKAVEKCIKIIRRKKLTFDAIAFRGLSGAVVAPLVALKLRKTLIAVRKTKSHGLGPVAGDLAARSYIIVDDLISSGTTVRKIVKALKCREAECKGVVLYNASYRTFRKVKPNGDLHI